MNSDDGHRRESRTVCLLSLLLCLLSFPGHALTQSDRSATDCATPEIVFERYVAALGGQAALSQVQTLVIEASETEPHTFNPQDTAHYRYQFRWKSPNRVVVKQHQFPVGWTTFIYSGTAWSNFDGRLSHNDDNTPAWRNDLRSSPYNDNPQFLMYRVVADPMLLATARSLYPSFETLPDSPGMCVLQAIGKSEWGAERRDTLSFDSRTGLLKSWAIQMGQPGSEKHTYFQFNDYRRSGPVEIPFSIYFDFYKATSTLPKLSRTPRCQMGNSCRSNSRRVTSQHSSQLSHALKDRSRGTGYL
jgi:hypothetical protein